MKKLILYYKKFISLKKVLFYGVITFFAKHSGSLSEMTRHLNESLKFSKRQSFTCNNIETLREMSLRDIGNVTQ